MKKYLVTIEFRYTSKREYSSGGNMYINKTITVGVYEYLETACIEGNKILEVLESRFKLHKFPQGHEAVKERFSKNGGCFGSAKNLITNSAYLKTPFSFYAKIDTLHYEDLGQTIDNVLTDLI
jgi:hypothetical protein